MKKTTLQKKVWNGSQSVNYEKIVKVEHLDYAPQKVKISIKRDSYDRQSYLRSYLWTNEGWEFVASLDIKQSNSDAIFYQTKVNQNTDEAIQAVHAMGLDARNLLEITLAVIF